MEKMPESRSPEKRIRSYRDVEPCEQCNVGKAYPSASWCFPCRARLLLGQHFTAYPGTLKEDLTRATTRIPCLKIVHIDHHDR
jgi:hypothetical protein